MANLTKNKKSTAIVNYDEELAKHAQQAADTEQTPAGQFVSTRGGILSVAGQPVKDNKMQAIIVDYVYENHLFETKFDPDNPASPVCFAFAREGGELKPHEASTKPQSETCAVCPHNVFGSDTLGSGKGKACKNIRRLALIPATDDPEAVKDSEAFYMKLPVTSVKGWSYYVKALAAAVRRPPFAVVTEIGVVPDAKTQFKVTFAPGNPLGNDVVAAVMTKRDEIAEQLVAPYQPTPEPMEEKPAPKQQKRKF